MAFPAFGQVIPNDNFAKAKVLPDKVPLMIRGNLVHPATKTYATRQEGEPRHAGRPGFGSVWYSWKSKTDRRIAVSADSEKVGVVLAVYTGRSLKDLTLVHRYENFAYPAFSRRRSEPFTAGARVEFNAKAYTQYYFAIDTENRFFDVFDLQIEESRNPLKPEQELMKPGHKWEYLLARTRDGVPYDPEYLDKDFDTTWMKPDKYEGPEFEGPGESPLGYGDLGNGRIRTYIGGSPDYVPAKGARYACYFRTTITPDLEVKALGFEGIIDDGAIIYINGKEALRMNMLPNVDANDWKAFALVARFDNTHVTENTIQYGVVEGLNLPADEPVEIAVSLHNNNPTSSDIGLNLRVYAVTPGGSPLAAPAN